MTLSILNETHIGFMVTGSIVSSLQGEPRATHDVDIVKHPDESISAIVRKKFLTQLKVFNF